MLSLVTLFLVSCTKFFSCYRSLLKDDALIDWFELLFGVADITLLPMCVFIFVTVTGCTACLLIGTCIYNCRTSYYSS